MDPHLLRLPTGGRVKARDLASPCNPHPLRLECPCTGSGASTSQADTPSEAPNSRKPKRPTEITLFLNIKCVIRHPFPIFSLDIPHGKRILANEWAGVSLVVWINRSGIPYETNLSPLSSVPWPSA
jgi:hypothetical protein